jgi:C4-dicarboxylate-specific signal transduction histidine kinase
MASRTAFMQYSGHDPRRRQTGSFRIHTILTEILANALDSGANRICLTTDSAGASLTVVDNSSGMPRHELRRYHDLATSTKTRGQGIGFAGVGMSPCICWWSFVSWHCVSEHNNSCYCLSQRQNKKARRGALFPV